MTASDAQTIPQQKTRPANQRGFRAVFRRKTKRAAEAACGGGHCVAMPRKPEASSPRCPVRAPPGRNVVELEKRFAWSHVEVNTVLHNPLRVKVTIGSVRSCDRHRAPGTSAHLAPVKLGTHHRVHVKCIKVERTQMKLKLAYNRQRDVGTASSRRTGRKVLPVLPSGCA